MDSDKETQVICQLLEIIDVLARDIMESDLEIVKWRHALLKYLPSDYAQFLEADMLDQLNAGCYWRYKGYRLYVGLLYNGKDPQESSSYHRRLYRMRNGTSKDADKLTYAVSQRGGMDMFSAALERVKEEAVAVANGTSSMDSLEPAMDNLGDIVLAYDQKSRYLSRVNDSLREALDESEASIIRLKEEISLLYKLLRTSGIEIPEEGHPVNLGPFADSGDPYREAYEGDYELPWRFFDSDETDS